GTRPSSGRFAATFSQREKDASLNLGRTLRRQARGLQQGFQRDQGLGVGGQGGAGVGGPEQLDGRGLGAVGGGAQRGGLTGGQPQQHRQLARRGNRGLDHLGDQL